MKKSRLAIKADFIAFARLNGLAHHCIEYKATQWIIRDIETALDNLISYDLLSSSGNTVDASKWVKVRDTFRLLKVSNPSILAIVRGMQ